MDVCVEISGLWNATEVSLTVTLEGVSSGKAGRHDYDLFCLNNLMKFLTPQIIGQLCS